MFGCEEATGENETESKHICDCLNECEVTSFSTAISAGKLSPNIILEDIPDSSDIPHQFVAALETRHRVVESLMMTTVPQLKAAIEAYKQMRFHINTDILDVRTSWAMALSKLLTSLGNMIRGHIDDSLTLLDILNDVYWKHVDYLVTGLSSSLELVDSQSAQIRFMIKIVHATSYDFSLLRDRLQVLNNLNKDARSMARNFEEMLDDEARTSSRPWHYYPKLLRIDDCASTFRNVNHSLETQWLWLEEYIQLLGNEQTDMRVLFDLYRFTLKTPFITAELRSDIVRTTKCLLSYKEQLLAFRSELDSQLAALGEGEFRYDPPTSSMLMFNAAGHWLQSITRQYVDGSLSKLELAEALHRNGSEVLDAVERLYSDIELSLFTKVSNEVDKQETEMVSFYSSVLRRVSELERYMYENDTSLEQFMRRFSIWRMPIVNYQTSQVLLVSFFDKQLCLISVSTVNANNCTAHHSVGTHLMLLMPCASRNVFSTASESNFIDVQITDRIQQKPQWPCVVSWLRGGGIDVCCTTSTITNWISLGYCAVEWYTIVDKILEWWCGARPIRRMACHWLEHTTHQCLRNDLYCVGWGVKLYSLTPPF